MPLSKYNLKESQKNKHNHFVCENQFCSQPKQQSFKGRSWTYTFLICLIFGEFFFNHQRIFYIYPKDLFITFGNCLCKDLKDLCTAKSYQPQKLFYWIFFTESRPIEAAWKWKHFFRAIKFHLLFGAVQLWLPSIIS